MSMLFSEQAARLLERSLSIMGVFCWRRNRERLMEFTSLLSKVTPSVARLIALQEVEGCSLVDEHMEIRRDLIFIKSSSFAIAQVFQIRLEKPVA